MKLIIGANERQVEGYVHHDVLPLKGIDIVCEFYDLPNHVMPETCEEIQMTHFLEHFPTKETQKVLNIVKTMLAPNGTLYIEVPNFAWHAKLVSEGRDRDAVYYAFGGQLDEWDFHKTGFTKDILFEELAKAGFTHIQIKDNSSLSATCQK